MDAEQIFGNAEALRVQGDDRGAAGLYGKLVEIDGLPGGMSCYRLGEIFNRAGKPEEALKWHNRAFELAPNLASRITKPDHLQNGYVFTPFTDKQVPDCPICGEPGTLWSVNNCVTNRDFIAGFNPIRHWMMCNPCQHVFAGNYPVNLGELLSASAPQYWLEPEMGFFRPIAQTVGQLVDRAPGLDLLEVGCGAGEFAAVSQEFGFRVRGLEIRPVFAEAIKQRFGVQVDVEDFLQVGEERKYDVVAMGDVIEHFDVPPAQVVAKAAALLRENGLFYVSTPNVMSVFALTMRDADPMRRVCEHINYFSRASLDKVLGQHGFRLEKYDMSPRYNGSMEVIARLEG